MWEQESREEVWGMSKGSTRRPCFVSGEEMDRNWSRAFGKPSEKGRPLIAEEIKLLCQGNMVEGKAVSFNFPSKYDRQFRN